MAITPVGTDGTTAASAQGTAVTTAWPAGITDGDCVLLEVSYGSGGTPTTISQTSGATMTLISDASDTSTRTATYLRFFATGDAAPSFTLSAARSWATHTTAMRGVAQAGTVNQSNQTAQASSTSYASGSITPSVDGCMVVVAWGGKVAAGATQTVTVASGWTDTAAINQSAIAAVVNNWCDFQYKPQATAAPVSESVTIGTAAVGQATIIALRAAFSVGALTAADASGTLTPADKPTGGPS